jgi:hypothetical protein
MRKKSFLGGNPVTRTLIDDLYMWRSLIHPKVLPFARTTSLTGSNATSMD